MLLFPVYYLSLPLTFIQLITETITNVLEGNKWYGKYRKSHGAWDCWSSEVAVSNRMVRVGLTEKVAFEKYW